MRAGIDILEPAVYIDATESNGGCDTDGGFVMQILPLTWLFLAAGFSTMKGQNDSVNLPITGSRNAVPSITRIRADFIRVRRTIIGETRSVPPHALYKIEGYDYSITFEIFQRDSTTLVGSFGIVCFLPDGSIRKIPIVEDNMVRRSPEIVEYSLPLEIQIEGLHRFLIAHHEDLNSGRDPKHYQHVSNTQSLYLETPSE